MQNRPLACFFVAGLVTAVFAQSGCNQNESLVSDPVDSDPPANATATIKAAPTTIAMNAPAATTSTKDEGASTPSKKKSTPDSDYVFQSPIRLQADGEFISVDAPGYACPTMADVDGDGKHDLVVGQFNEGHMRFFKNVAETGQTPKFAGAEWVMTGDQKAVVPGVW